jgi:pimeloyl-ACP methyl ester carboxylesterase
MERGFRYTSDWGNVWVHRYGQGPRLLLAQHGFGRDGRRFRELGTAIGSQYTLLAPDLPFHGATEWSAERYSPKQWLACLTAIAEQAGDSRCFHYLGHSLGGRIGLRLFTELRPHLASFCLVAPDGLSGPYTRWIDRLPTPVVRALGRTLHYPGQLLSLATRLHRWRLIDSLSYQYLYYQLQDTAFRDRLYGTLRSITDFRLRSRMVIDTLATAEKEVKIFVGRRDRLVNVDHIHQLFADAANVAVELTNHGHELPSALLRDYYLEQKVG